MTSENRKTLGYALLFTVAVTFIFFWTHNIDTYSFIASAVQLDNSLRISQGTKVCTKGSFQMSKSWIISRQLPEFIEVYNERPFVSNRAGTKVMHHFALWCMIKRLRPAYIIESGIYQGFGTWMMRQAAPNARLILLDPRGQKLKYRDKQNQSVYLINRDFIDFGSVDWTKYVSDPAKALVFIDDHQSPLVRIRHAKQHGFKHLMFDDNYWMGGDVSGLKTICHFVLGEAFEGSSGYRAPKPGTKTVPQVWAEDLRNELSTDFSQNIAVYYEFPMIWNSTRANTNKRTTRNMLFNSADGVKVLKDFGLVKLPPPTEIDGYYNIAYVKVE